MLKLSIRRPRRLAWLALLTRRERDAPVGIGRPGRRARRGAVLVKDIKPGGSSSITDPDCNCGGDLLCRG